jgi:hypothetical protein
VSDLSVTVKRLFDTVWNQGGLDDGCSMGFNPATQYVNGVLARADVGRLVGHSINFRPQPYYVGY